ncbi:MAG: hypothetical protein LBD24_06850 [Spirochaetaceae bacterium]|jgi:hypothetical protein|nr:hypothetical protein [Spirochaetaceae bacterium]
MNQDLFWFCEGALMPVITLWASGFPASPAPPQTGIRKEKEKEGKHE